jgi:hypothetical protein
MEGPMAKTSLTDMQRVILSGAAMRLDLKVLPVPKSLQKGDSAVGLSLKPLLGRGLVDEVAASPEDAVWREDAERGKLALVITAAGMEAIGVFSEGRVAADPAVTEEDRAKSSPSGPAGAPEDAGSAERQEPRAGSKLGLLIAALRQPSGATIPDIMEVTGWQAHSIRGAMSSALKKKLGLNIISELIEGRGRVYRIAMSEARVAEAAIQSPDDLAPRGDQPIDAASAKTGAAEPV